MSDEAYRYLDVGFKLLATVAAVIAFYQLKEVKRKRHIDMYWKIADLYFSEEQREARANVDVIRSYIEALKANSMNLDEILNHYNSEYHITENIEKRKIDKSIINRIRFLNQTGVLLRRNLIDRDLLFGLIGVGFELDYPIIKIVLDAHRLQHQMPYMYLDIENGWDKYQVWKRNRKLQLV